MKRYTIFSKATARRQMNASCSGTRTPFWSASCSKKVSYSHLHRCTVMCSARQIGIDVQAELKTKEESTQSAIPSLSVALPTPAQRAVLNRHHQVQRGNPGTTPRLIQAQKSRSNTLSSQSPQLQPTPVSQTSSPTTSRSPIYVMQGGMTSPHATNQAQHQFQQQQLQQPLRPASFPHSHTYPSIIIPNSSPGVQNLQHGMASAIGEDGRESASSSRPTQWSSSYQTHMEQLGKLTRPFLPSFLYRALFVLD